MATPIPEMDDLQLQEKEEPWNSRAELGSGRPKESYQHNNDAAQAEDDREAALRSELKSVRDINAVIQGVVESLERAKGNMESVSRTVSSASTLLDTWTRILSQTEHNRRLVLDPSWHGATQDMADMETEARERQQEAERRELELQQRKLEQERKAEEEQRKRAAQTSSASRGRRGIVRPSTRTEHRLDRQPREFQRALGEYLLLEELVLTPGGAQGLQEVGGGYGEHKFAGRPK
ncbi:hypothetical protein MferCBS31731_006390 [Microsporum ferrugineum]